MARPRFENGTMIVSVERIDAKMEHDIVAAPIKAWRVWRVYSGGLHPLTGGKKGFEEGQRASCLVMNHGDGKVVFGICSCGFWSMKTREGAEKVAHMYTALDTHVVAEVELWGKVVEHEVGYRSEFIRPVSMTLRGPHAARRSARELQEQYGVEVKTGRLWRYRRFPLFPVALAVGVALNVATYLIHLFK